MLYFANYVSLRFRNFFRLLRTYNICVMYPYGYKFREPRSLTARNHTGKKLFLCKFCSNCSNRTVLTIILCLEFFNSVFLSHASVGGFIGAVAVLVPWRKKWLCSLQTALSGKTISEI